MPTDVYIWILYVSFGTAGADIFISTWASALLVQLWWAMRRPQCVEQVTGTDSHAFSCMKIKNRNGTVDNE